MYSILRDGERFDELGGGCQIIQHPDKYCFTSDATHLANFISAAPHDVACDLGTGSGIIAILLALQTKVKRVWGIELQPDMADMASRSVLHNNLQERVSIVNLPLQKAHEVLGYEQMSIVCVNPPYGKAGTGFARANQSINISRSEECVTLEEIVVAASRLLKFGGKFYMVNRPERLAEIFWQMKKHNLEPKIMKFINNNKSVLIQATKGAKSGLEVIF